MSEFGHFRRDRYRRHRSGGAGPVIQDVDVGGPPGEAHDEVDEDNRFGPAENKELGVEDIEEREAEEVAPAGHVTITENVEGLDGDDKEMNVE